MLAGRQAEGYFKFKYQFKCKLVFESRKEPSEFGGRGWKAGINQGRFRKESQTLTSKMLTNSPSGTCILLPSESLNISPEKLNTYSNHSLKSELYLYGQAKYSYSEMGCQPNTIFL